MKKTLLFAIMILSILSVQAQKKVAYITFAKTMDATAGTTLPTSNANDPIIQTLSADPALSVTVKVLTSVLATDVIADLATYDVIIVQESFSSTAGMLTPAGALALKTIPKPFVYNKSYAFKKGGAFPSTSTSTGVGKEADGTAANGTLLITVDANSLNNDLFKGCTIVNGNQIKLFNALSTDLGLLGAATSVKALNYNSGASISGGTLLAQPAVLTTGFTTVAASYSDIPSGTVFDGTETTQARSILLGMNYGAICANAGKNITSDGLTIWRNAVYILAGLSVPSTPASLPTAVRNVTESSEIVSEMYYNVNGVQVREPNNNTNGVLIKKTTYKSGVVKSTKVALLNN
jgi:hypothetical protein